MRIRSSIAALVAVAALAQRAPAQATSASDPIGTWRGTSLCLVRPSPCRDEVVVYRIARLHGSDSVSIDARKIVNAREEEMGVLVCGLAGHGGALTCAMKNGVWYFTVRRDSMVGELRLPGGTRFRDVRTARAQERSHPTDAWTDPFPHRSGYVDANGVRLNYLDWGGTGPALVVVHGLADSPHVFDDLAASLRDRFHVVAYARRGHGRSDAPRGPYGLATLVEDLHQLLDRLAIPRASLLGWSMGGNEITAFAAAYPDRVEKLIYLEGGYDWSDSTFQAQFHPADPEPATLNSLDAYRVWYRRTWFGDTPWTVGLEAYLRDIVRIDSSGGVHPIPAGTVLDSLVASNASSPRDYSRVHAPTLALYASSFLPVDPTVPEAQKASQEWEDRVMRAFRRASIERVRREIEKVTIREVPNTAHMSILVAAPDTVTSLIKTFLLTGGDK